MNRIYSILVRAEHKGSVNYQRKVDTTVSYKGLESIADRLVQNGTDKSFYNYQAEQLVQICRKSLLKGTLSAIDPLNTYEYAFDGITPSTDIGDLPTGVYMDILEPDTRHTWSYQSLAININPTGLATVNGVATSFTTTDGMTSEIPLADGLGMKLRGTLPSYNFNTIVDVACQPTRDITKLISSLQDIPVTWITRYIEYQHSYDVNDWLAAYVLNYCETVDGS